MPITSQEAKRGLKIQIPTRMTYFPDSDIRRSCIVQIAKDLGRDHLFIECVEEAIAPYPEKVTVVLKLGDSGDWFTLQDLNRY